MPGLSYEVEEMAVEHAIKPMVLRPDTSPVLAAAAEPVSVRARIFLLSPANVSGIKGQRLLNPTGDSDYESDFSGELLMARWIGSDAP